MNKDKVKVATVKDLAKILSLLVKELQEFTTVPIFNSAMPNINRLVATLTGEKGDGSV